MNKTTTKTIGNASAVARALEMLGHKREEPRRADEFTIAEFALESGMQYTKARRTLEAGRAAGKLQRRSLPVDGTQTFLYSAK